MVRPTVLVVDREETRRKDLVRGLAGYAYEVVAAATAKEGKRYADGLKPAVIVVEGALVDVADPFGLCAPSARQTGAIPTTVLLLDAEIGVDVPEGVRTIAVTDISPDVILRKVRIVLLARELGVATDPGLESLVGDVQHLPLLELLPLLQRAAVTGRVQLGEGQLFLEEGEVVAARVEAQSGVKAFGRLARMSGGSFRVSLGPPPAERKISKDLLSLMAIAIEDQHQYEEARTQLPDLSSRLRLVTERFPLATQLSPSQQRVLDEAHTGRTLWKVLDRIDAPDGQVLGELTQLRALGILEFDMAEVNVRIVTDSTADLPEGFAKRHQIHVVPLSVIFGHEIYKDRVDLTPDGFYRLLQTRKGSRPRVHPPGKDEFLAEYRMLAARADVVSVHLPGRASETVANARAAAGEGAEELRQVRGNGGPVLRVVDSGQVSIGLALLVVQAARLAECRLTADEIATRLEAMRSRVHLLFVAETLEYLIRGGRLGRTRAWVEDVLGIKPILGLMQGEVVPVDQVRSRQTAHPRVIELLKQRVDVNRPVMVGIGHAAAPVPAVRLRNLLQDAFKVIEVIECEIGPAVGTLLGPGGVGAAVLQLTDEELALLAPTVTAG